MKNNLKETVVKAIAETQDGKILKEYDDWSDFIMCRINANSSNDNVPHVNIDNLIDDFNYMVDQLKRAIKPLEEFRERLPV